MKPIEDLTADYLQELDGQLHDADVLALPEGCERCSHCESGGSSQFARQCCKPAGHDGQHKYTRRGSMSRSLIRELISTLTVGDLKSLAGLDDVATIQGRENFIRMRKLIATTGACANLSAAETEALTTRVTKVEDFLRIGFVKHLHQHADRACCCMSCKFNTDDLKGLLSKATATIASREAANSEELKGEPEEARKRVLNQIWRDQESMGEEIGSMEEIEHDLHFSTAAIWRGSTPSQSSTPKRWQTSPTERRLSCATGK